MFIILRRVPRDIGRLSLKEIGHEDLVLAILVGVCKNIGTLDGLVEVAKDVVDDEDALLCILGTRCIYDHLLDVASPCETCTYRSSIHRPGCSRPLLSIPCRQQQGCCSTPGFVYILTCLLPVLSS